MQGPRCGRPGTTKPSPGRVLDLCPGRGWGMVQLTLVPTGVDTPRRRSLQAVGDAVEGVGDGGLQELQGHDDQDGDERQDEGVLHHALALFGALTQPSHQGLRRHDLLGYELAHVYLTFLCDCAL